MDTAKIIIVRTRFADFRTLLQLASHYEKPLIVFPDPKRENRLSIFTIDKNLAMALSSYSFGLGLPMEEVELGKGFVIDTGHLIGELLLWKIKHIPYKLALGVNVTFKEIEI